MTEEFAELLTILCFAAEAGDSKAVAETAKKIEVIASHERIAAQVSQ